SARWRRRTSSSRRLSRPASTASSTSTRRASRDSSSGDGGTMRIVTVCLAAIALSACRGAPAPSDDAARGEVEGAMRRYAETLVSGAPAGPAAFSCEAGELLEPGMAAPRGPAAIRSFLEPIHAAVTVERSAMVPQATDVAGDRAVQWGTYEQVVRDIQVHSA